MLQVKHKLAINENQWLKNVQFDFESLQLYV